MKNKMEAKNAMIKVLLIVLIIGFVNSAFGQKTKYLLFDKTKDTIVIVDGKKHYKISNNLFDIERYNEVDTVKHKLATLSKVNELRLEANQITDSIIKNLKPKEPISLDKTGIETNNNIFKFLYVLEKLPNCKYKRTRVWWVDY